MRIGEGKSRKRWNKLVVGGVAKDYLLDSVGVHESVESFKGLGY